MLASWLMFVLAFRSVQQQSLVVCGAVCRLIVLDFEFFLLWFLLLYVAFPFAERRQMQPHHVEPYSALCLHRAVRSEVVVPFKARSGLLPASNGSWHAAEDKE